MTFDEVMSEIRRKRKIRGITQEQMAEKMDVSVSMVSKWFRVGVGRSIPSVKRLFELADIVGYELTLVEKGTDKGISNKKFVEQLRDLADYLESMDY